MQTITFYSYKGGVGRTLAVANAADFLARFGLKVFAVDFDLEAPSLHYKFALDRRRKDSETKLGVVDYIHAFAVRGESPQPLRDHVIQIQPQEGLRGSIHLMPAGDVPTAQYWRRLAQINWHELFYSSQPDAEPPRGIPFFLELKEQIEREYAPDFLLIDARTGVTEIGGVATTILADKVVCFLLNNRENLEGVRAVLRSIRKARRLPGQPPVEILPVVTRIPEREDKEPENRIVARIKESLGQEAEDLASTLDIPEVFVLHSEPELQFNEALMIASDKTPDESPLLRDYLGLFGRLVPGDAIKP